MDAVAIPSANSVAKYYTDEDFDTLAKASDFLPRFQLYGSNSNACKESKINIGHYGYVQGDRIIDCTKEVYCWVLGLRLKALRITGDKVEANFNPRHPEFIKIKAESGVKDTGSLCGPEFLLYLPEQKQFVTFFMASKTMRREAPNVRDHLAKEGQTAAAMTLKSTLIKANGYSWHGPIVTGCSVPIENPDPEELLTELNKFNNPPEKQQEAASSDEVAATNRAR